VTQLSLLTRSTNLGDIGPPTTTIPPFNDINALPSCAVACVPLYDANGGCVPPAVNDADPALYTSCFCANANVMAFSTAATGVCDTACPNDPAGLTSIQAWFQSICSVDTNAGDTTTDDGAGPTSSGSNGDSDGSSGSNNSNGGGGDW
jgi:hypothetical protein